MAPIKDEFDGGKPGYRQVECLIRSEGLGVAGLSQDLLIRMRRLRKDMMACQACPMSAGGCVIRGEINSVVGQALEEVWEEWGR
jgi:hypothetical protein